ncbi:hypothetical protein TSUD_260560 [Trifolium subterraneum]|uniref:F-box domain-containing protein n=1 Tax=Trifolium subterraneum TaxID=3900 RepID=A0A2Z6P0H0_TRISU|nr:hypothetical protein TSUD_260560 [Trifolium subterraneum]
MEEASAATFPKELVVEIVSWLPVKYVMQLRCLNKFFNALIFDPHFVQMHLNKSTRNSQLASICFEDENHDDQNNLSYSLITFSIPCLLQNQLTIFHRSDPYYLSREYPDIFRSVVGSCNGLLCWFGTSFPSDQWIYFSNPATRKESEKFTLFFDYNTNPIFNFSFGYDNLTQTYKVVAFYVDEERKSSVVKVFTLGNNSWKDIQCLPVLPIYCLLDRSKNDGVHLNGTINWIAFCDDININSNFTVDSNVTVDQFVILSLDLSTETYTQFLLPRRFDEVPRYPPKLVVLMDCLCFYNDFVIWQMKDFGVEDSWIQLFKINHEHFYTWVDLLPLYLSENGDTLVLANVKYKEAFIYNPRDNKVEQIGIANHIKWSQSKGYVESLVSTH